MNRNSNRLTAKETEVMERLWNNGPQTVREMLATYPDPKPHFNTVATTVRILIDKGYVAHTGERGGAFVYGAAVEAGTLGPRSLAQVVKSYFNNSYRSAVASLIEEEKISLSELREIIAMVERNGKDYE